MTATVLARCGQRWRHRLLEAMGEIVDEREIEGRTENEREFRVRFDAPLAEFGGWVGEEAFRGDWTFVAGPTDQETGDERLARVIAIEAADVPKGANPRAWARVARAYFLTSAEASTLRRESLGDLRAVLAFYLDGAAQFHDEGQAP